METLSALSLGFCRALRPLAERLGDNTDDVPNLLSELGYPADLSPAATFEPLQTACGELLDKIGGVEDTIASLSDSDSESALATPMAELLGALAGTIAAVESLPGSLPASAGDFNIRLYYLLIIDALKQKLALGYAFLLLFGIIEDPVRELEDSTTYPQIYLDRITKLVSDPGALFAEVYGWGTPELDVEKLFGLLLRLSFVFGHPAELEIPESEALQGMGVDALIKPDEGPDYQLLVPIWSNDNFGFATRIFPLPRSSDTSPQGLAVSLSASGAWQETVTLTDFLTLDIQTIVLLDSGVALIIQPSQGLSLKDLTQGNLGQVLKDAELSLKLTYANPDSAQKVALLSFWETSGLFAQQLYLTILAGADGVGNAQLGLEAGIVGGELKIAMDQSDSFVSSIVPKEGFHFDFDLAVGWSNTKGLYFKGAGMLETTLTLNQSFGPISLDLLHLGFGLDTEKIKLLLGVSLSGKLGPLSISVENIGVAANLKFENGNLGPVNLGFDFKPPKGLALSISASVVKGGGYLMLDPDKGEYAGTIMLSIQSKFVFTAMGILTTKFPDGTEGYSLLIIICAKFPPITLGFGFFLNGLGGLLGIHRTMDVDVMREGVKQGTVDNILFPNPDTLIENIIKIISDIKAIFPVAKDQFVVGPMALITWGPQPILSVKLGIVIELTHPFRLNILGVLRVALPQGAEAPLIQIQVNFFGSLDFDKGTLTFDASLFDSFLGTSGYKFTLEGDMALRIFWGEAKEFLLSVGGFHPAFHPAANLKVSNMKRLTLSLLTGNPHLTLTTYFALTSNTVQFGAAIDFYFSIASFSIEGYFGFDVLFQFTPFHMIADIEARLAVKCGSSELFSVGLSFELDGPSPWHAKGKAKFKVWFISYTAHFDKTFGEKKETTVPLVAVEPLLLEALNTDRAWQGEIPEGSFTTVSVRKPEEEEEGILLHGHGLLTIRQNVMPLGTEISRFGANPPLDLKEAEIAEVRLGHTAQADGTVGKELNLSAVKDLFAPANFKTMSDADKLKAPSFEQMASGVRAEGTDGASVTYGLNRPVEYEQLISDEDPEADGSVKSKPVSQGLKAMPKARFAQFVGGGAIGQSALSKANVLKRLALDNQRVKVGAEEFAVVFKENLKKYPGSFGQGTRDEADRALAELAKANPGLADKLRMVPAYQAVS